MPLADMNLALNQARIGLDVSDYFNNNGATSRFNGATRPRSPYPSDYEPDGYSSSHGMETSVPSVICR